MIIRHKWTHLLMVLRLINDGPWGGGMELPLAIDPLKFRVLLFSKKRFCCKQMITKKLFNKIILIVVPIVCSLPGPSSPQCKSICQTWKKAESFTALWFIDRCPHWAVIIFCAKQSIKVCMKDQNHKFSIQYLNFIFVFIYLYRIWIVYHLGFYARQFF